MANDRKTQFGWAPNAQQPNAQPLGYDTNGRYAHDNAPTGRFTPSRGTPSIPQTQPAPNAPTGYGSDAQYMATYGYPSSPEQAQQAVIDTQHAQAAAMYGADYANAAFPQATAVKQQATALRARSDSANPRAKSPSGNQPRARRESDNASRALHVAAQQAQPQAMPAPTVDVDAQHAQAMALYGAAYANAAYPQAAAARQAAQAHVQPYADPSTAAWAQHAQAAAMYGVDYANAAYPTATAAMAAAYNNAYPAQTSSAPAQNAQLPSAYPSAALYTQPPASVQAPSPAPAPARADSTDNDLRKNANATVGVSDRVRFIRLTYLHLLMAILVFAGLEWVVQTKFADTVVNPFTDWALTGRNWGIVLGVFMAVSWVADRYASKAKNRAAQYFGLLLYVCAEVAIFIPLLALVQYYTKDVLAAGGENPNILRDAGFTTVGVFLVLTLSVLVSKKDFSFLRGGLAAASGAALTLIFMSILWGFSLGLAFSVGMVLVASGYILFNTSQVLAHYDTRAHVAAALSLFSSLALLFWYVIRIFMRMRGGED